MIEQKKCPCCGGVVSVRSRFAALGFQVEIECRSCGLVMRKDGVTPSSALLKATEAWNNRVSDVRTSEEIKEMLLIFHDIAQNSKNESEYFEAKGQEEALLWVLKILPSLDWT